ncbi:RNA 3'-phosphate cyclase [Deltaproteobacteria bacterium Smac51]|nr:RNA 3'-phosphate cyclase [Deltaproteobacteria bacterium Smac51]
MSMEIQIIGSMGEGGGQVLRTALALSVATGRAFTISGIRANRPRPGMKRQHLACVRAAAAISGAEVIGAEINSASLSFRPSARPSGGDYRFDIGGGGSCTLVLQAVLPPLMTAESASTITVCGGTHVPMAPVYEFFSQTLLPRLEKMGPRLSARLLRPGFMQVGGGVMEVSISPVRELQPLEMVEVESGFELEGFIRSYGLPESIAEREAAVLGRLRSIQKVTVENLNPGETGAGNVALLKLTRQDGVTITSGVAQRGLAAEKVARQATSRMLQFLKADVPVEACLADQLIVPLALASGGRFITEKPTLHTQTVLELLPYFTDLKTSLTEVSSRSWLVEIKK